MIRFVSSIIGLHEVECNSDIQWLLTYYPYPYNEQDYTIVNNNCTIDMLLLKHRV